MISEFPMWVESPTALLPSPTLLDHPAGMVRIDIPYIWSNEEAKVGNGPKEPQDSYWFQVVTKRDNTWWQGTEIGAPSHDARWSYSRVGSDRPPKLLCNPCLALTTSAANIYTVRLTLSSCPQHTISMLCPTTRMPLLPTFITPNIKWQCTITSSPEWYMVRNKGVAVTCPVLSYAVASLVRSQVPIS